MTARADTCVWLDDVPSVRVNRLPARDASDVTARAILSVADVLTVFAPVDVLRATLTVALAALAAAGVEPDIT